MARQGRPGNRALTLDQVEGARREAGGVDNLGIERRRQGRVLRGFQNAGAAGGERRNDLESDLVDRPVPRRDQAADPDGLAHQDLAVRQRLARVLLFQCLYERLEMADSRIGLRLARHGDRRAHLGGHRPGEVLQPGGRFFQQPVQERQPLRLGRPRIGFERGGGRSDGAVHVGLVAKDDRADPLFGRGIQDGKFRLARRRHPFAADVKGAQVAIRHPVSSRPSVPPFGVGRKYTIRPLQEMRPAGPHSGGGAAEFRRPGRKFARRVEEWERVESVENFHGCRKFLI